MRYNEIHPMVPYNTWSILEHRPENKLELELSKTLLYAPDYEQKGRVIYGREIYKELAGFHSPNASVLDYLLSHPNLIPPNWKSDKNGSIIYIFFLGTIYIDLVTFNRCVRGLCFVSKSWRWVWIALDNLWDIQSFVLITN